MIFSRLLCNGEIKVVASGCHPYIRRIFLPVSGPVIPEDVEVVGDAEANPEAVGRGPTSRTTVTLHSVRETQMGRKEHY